MSSTLNWKWSEGPYPPARRTLHKGWGYSLFQIHRQQNSLQVISSATVRHGTSEANHDQVCVDFKWCPVNCKSSRTTSWTEQMAGNFLSQPRSKPKLWWDKKQQVPNWQFQLSSQARYQLELINPLISRALKVRNHHMWAVSLKASLHFPGFCTIATPVTNATTYWKAPTLLTTQPLVTQICTTSPLRVFFSCLEDQALKK